jgi:hypothetical protein
MYENTRASYITSKDRTFSEFKNLLFKYYILSLENTYDVDDSRTWKSVCIKCNSARSSDELSIDMLLLDIMINVMTVVQVLFIVCVL